jgi:hypothetical protein
MADLVAVSPAMVSLEPGVPALAAPMPAGREEAVREPDGPVVVTAREQVGLGVAGLIGLGRAQAVQETANRTADVLPERHEWGPSPRGESGGASNPLNYAAPA